MRVSSVHGVVAGILVVLVGALSAPMPPLRRAAEGGASTPCSGSEGFGFLIEVLRSERESALVLSEDPGRDAREEAPAPDSEAPVRAASEPAPGPPDMDAERGAGTPPRR